MKTELIPPFIMRARFSLLVLSLLAVSAFEPANAAILFSDDFEDGSLAPWTIDSGDTDRAGVNNDTSQSGSQSMFVNGGNISIVSPVIDTSQPDVTLTVWIRRGDDNISNYPENGEDLRILYRDNDDDRVLLDTIPGGANNDDFDPPIVTQTYSLPADALHSDFQLYFEMTQGSGDSFDFWHIDDVELSTPEPLAIGSCEDFEQGLGNWTINSSGGDAGTSSATSSPNSPTQSLFTNGGVVSVESDVLDTSSVGSLEIEMWIRRGDDSFSEDPDNSNENLVVEYYDNNNTWQTLATYDGGGTPGEVVRDDADTPFTPGTSAQHADFQLRVRQTGGSGSSFDYWHVDEVCFSDASSTSPQIEFRMDEATWDGTAGEVIDSSGNGNDGTAMGGATTDDSSPAIAGDPGTCGYGTFDGSDDYVEVANLSNILNDTASLTFWIRTTQNGNDTGWQAPGVAGIEQAGGTDDIFWGWIDASGNIGISVANDFDGDQKSNTEVNDGNWHHVVLTRDASNGDTKIYVDGVLETSGNTGNGVIGNTYSSIGRIEDTGGSPEYFDGDLDEVNVFDRVLTDSEVTTLFNATHDCTEAATCAADFAIHGDSQLDVGNNVTVNGNTVTGSGNSIDPVTGQRENSNPPLPMFSPNNFPSFSGPDRQVSPDGPTFQADDYGDIQVNNNQTANFDTSNGNDFRIDTLVADNGAILNLQPGRYFIDQLQLNNNAELNVVGGGTVEIFINDQFQGGNNALINSGGSAGDLLVRMYNGAQLQLSNVANFTGLVYAPGSNTQVQLSNNVQFNGGIFSGGQVQLSDNVDITYSAAAEQAARQIAQCDPTGPDHYSISHAGSGVTCLAEDVTVTAHDVSDNAVDPGNVTIDLTTTTGRGDWSAIVSGTGTLNDGTQGDGAATYTFPGGETSVTLTFNYTNIPSGDSESFFFDVTDGTASDLGDGDPEDPQMTFARTGFQFVNQTDGNATIPTQIAGKSSDTAPNAKSLAIRAVRSSDDDPSVCVAEFANESKTLEFDAECRDPASCAGQNFSINGNTFVPNDDNGTTGATDYTQPVSLTFDSNGVAPLVLNYLDAGLMQLHARYEIPLDDGSDTPSGDFMRGSSNDYVVRPFGFDIAVSGNPGATDASGGVLAPAGADFDVTTTAVLWQQADDGNNDGVPDGHEASDTDAGNNADLSDNAATPNFGQEASAATATLTSRLDQPGGGVAGTLSGGTSVSGFSGGSATTTIQYDEVGIIELRADTPDYLTGGQDVTGLSGYVGRFIPDRFDVTANTPVLADGCGAGDFTYQDQNFYYDTAPVLTVTALNTSGNTTNNYGDAFWQLSTSLSNRTYTDQVTPAPTADFTAQPLASVTLAGDGDFDGQGILSQAAGSSGDIFRYSRNTPEAEFDADVDTTFPAVDLTDSDGVCYDSDDDGSCEAFTIQNITGTELRFGRLRMNNAAGSELLPLPVPMQAQYYDGTAFVPNTADSCTGIAPTDLSLTSTVEANQTDGDVDVSNAADCADGTTTASVANNPFSNGEAGLSFSAPGESCVGDVDITLDLDALGLGYLRFDWEDVDGAGDGPYDDNPAARASFGIFAGQREFIYRREPW